MTPTATVEHYPESVARLCAELQRLSAEIVETRKRIGGFPASQKGDDDNAMEVDQVESKAAVDPMLQQRLSEGVRTGNMLLSLLKTLNRDVLLQERDLKNDLTEQKLSVGQVDLGYQNIKYQRKYLLNEISRCRDMQTLYQDVPLVPLEEFREKAPEHLVQSATDDHQLMLNRLQFELEERKRFDAEKRRLLTVKLQLTKANKIRRTQINKAEKQLEEYIQSSQSLQELFREPVEPVRTHKEILLAEANAALASSGATTTDGALSSTMSNGDATMGSPSQDEKAHIETETGVDLQSRRHGEE